MKQSKTPFGYYFTKLRKSRSETIEDAAQLLGISPAYISAIEYGHRDIPKDLRKKIIKKYKLKEMEIAELDRCIYATPLIAKVSIEDVKQCMFNLIDSATSDPKEREKYKKEFIDRLNQLRNQKK